MTRDEARALCIAAMARANHPNYERLSEAQKRRLRRDAARYLDALHGVAWVISIDSTNGSRPLRYGNIENSNLTNAETVPLWRGTQKFLRERTGNQL